MRRSSTARGLAAIRWAARLAVVCALGLAGAARAETLPAGSMGVLFGAGGGTGAYARPLGLGYHQFGGQAAWQPMTTERRIGWSLKWDFVFGTMYGADATRIDTRLRTLQMDFLVGVRVRPGASPGRYLVLRGGLELFRSNEVIPPTNPRAFVGPVADLGLEQYAFGIALLNVDVRYGLIGSGPAEIALLVGASFSVP
jgi:hypothetical protein